MLRSDKESLHAIHDWQDAYVHVTLIKKWDICPGDAILRALGGKLTTLRGEDVDYAGRQFNRNKIWLEFRLEKTD